uniref:Uncharacterized protein n=1 Tax=Fagus sylvatica TaxID=28930 RepID=A0A2N9IZA6_FAGSY
MRFESPPPVKEDHIELHRHTAVRLRRAPPPDLSQPDQVRPHRIW